MVEETNREWPIPMGLCHRLPCCGVSAALSPAYFGTVVSLFRKVYLRNFGCSTLIDHFDFSFTKVRPGVGTDV